MSSHIQLVEDGRLIGLDGRPWAATPINAWAGFPCEVHHHMRKGEVARRYNPHPLVFVRYGARGRSRIESRRRTYDLTVAPGQVDIYPAGFQMDRGWWDCTPGELISIELSPPPLKELLQSASESFCLRTTLSGSDPFLVRLVDCMRYEIDRGCPIGKLFADGLSLALLAYLRAKHAETSAAPEPRQRLSKVECERIGGFIEAHLGSDLRVAQLAALVALSPHHFIRVFRIAFGMTPHRYVLQRRLEAARRMLKTDTAIADIAYALGFSSQAHFTQAFHRYTGSTPARVRYE